MAVLCRNDLTDLVAELGIKSREKYIIFHIDLLTILDHVVESILFTVALSELLDRLQIYLIAQTTFLLNLVEFQWHEKIVFLATMQIKIQWFRFKSWLKSCWIHNSLNLTEYLRIEFYDVIYAKCIRK